MLKNIPLSKHKVTHIYIIQILLFLGAVIPNQIGWHLLAIAMQSIALGIGLVLTIALVIQTVTYQIQVEKHFKNAMSERHQAVYNYLIKLKNEKNI